jgi:hypothetical protein
MVCFTFSESSSGFSLFWWYQKLQLSVSEILAEVRALYYRETCYSVKRDLYSVKRDLYSVKRDLLQCQKRPTTVSKRPIQCQKRPTTVSKETYYSVKRDLLQCQKRPTTVSKETYNSVKRDLLQCQERPTTVSKETYYNFKRDLLQCQKRPTTVSTIIGLGNSCRSASIVIWRSDIEKWRKSTIKNWSKTIVVCLAPFRDSGTKTAITPHHHHTHSMSLRWCRNQWSCWHR